MRDIAARADVSIGTVSRVLNGKFDVAPELGERVRLAAQELGYERRSFSRSLFSTRVALGPIAYMVDQSAGQVSSDPFQQHFLAGIESGANELGGHVLFTACGDDVERGTVPQMISKKLVSGVIAKGNAMDAWLRKISALLPVVLIMNEESSRSIPSVICDNYQGTFQVLSHLYALGHRRIGFFYEKEITGGISLHHLEREAAFRKYTALLGCATQAEYIQALARHGTKEETLHTAERALHHFRSMGERRPTAVVCASDFHAFAFLRAAFNGGLRVPEDLSVTGFMNTPAGEHSNPPLTSVCLFGEEIGRVAVELLYARMKDPTSIPRHVVVGTRLVERHSAAAPGQG